MSNKEWDKISYAQSQSLCPPDIIDFIDGVITNLEEHDDFSSINISTVLSLLYHIRKILLPF